MSKIGVIDNKWQIYLGGKMDGLSFEDMNTWRKLAKSKLIKASNIACYRVSVINPVDFYNFESVRYQSDAEVMDYDLAHLKSSDILIVNTDGLNTSTGTQIEIYEAWKNNIPVFTFGEYCSIHPWIKRCITRHEKNIDDVVAYIQDFYFI